MSGSPPWIKWFRNTDSEKFSCLLCFLDRLLTTLVKQCWIFGHNTFSRYRKKAHYKLAASKFFFETVHNDTLQLLLFLAQILTCDVIKTLSTDLLFSTIIKFICSYFNRLQGVLIVWTNQHFEIIARSVSSNWCSSSAELNIFKGKCYIDCVDDELCCTGM